MPITIRVDDSATVRMLRDLGKQGRFAMAVALTRTAKHAQALTLAEMRTQFDRPTPWTLNSLWVKPAKKTDLEAQVYVKDQAFGKTRLAAAQILEHEFAGGSRRSKGSEYWLRRAGLISEGEYVVPGAAAKLDSYGNMNRGQVQQVLSQLKAGPDPQAYASKSRRSRRTVKRAGRIFWSRGGRLKRGAWIDNGGGSVRPLLLVVGSTSYRRRIDMQTIANRAIAERFDAEFWKALETAMATAR